MTVGQFKQFLKENNISDNIHMGILDESTDDAHDANYGIAESNISILDCTSQEDLEVPNAPTKKGLFFTFSNVLNPNPVF